MDKNTMTLVFTSYRDSMNMEGLKVSLDRRMPKLCSYPTLSYLVMPLARNLNELTVERICIAIIDGSWDLIRDFIQTIYDTGIKQIVFCDWCTREQIANGKFCPAGMIGKYIADRKLEFDFPLEIEYADGREAL